MITMILLCVGIGATAVLMVFANSETADAPAEPAYATEIFGADIISIDILCEQTEFDTMIENATAEEYIMVDVVVNGTTFQNVGLRPKGNSSLTQVSQKEGSERYSFKLKFDEYIKDQTCFGLGTFVVNNMISDATYMKEYMSYSIMRSVDVPTPLFGYTSISVNGENFGFYLAIESYDDSFLERTYGTSAGELYSVKSMEVGGGMSGTKPTGEMPDRQTNQATKTETQTGGTEDTAQPTRQNMGGGMGGRGSSGGDLKYSDDNSSSYSAIFDNAVGKTTVADEARVITALKNLSDGTALTEYFDVDEILRYFAAHTVCVNLDSYSSSMAQNYYLYEKDGKISVLPWDYNLAFGGFQSGSATDVVNFPIDTPVSGIELSERPLLAKLLENEEYMAKYHEYLAEIVNGYFPTLSQTIDTLDAKIATYVQNDPSAFTTYAQYKTGIKTLLELGNLRATSITGQLDGTIPSTTAAQAANPSLLINADSLNLSDMGSQGGGGGKGDRGERPTMGEKPTVEGGISEPNVNTAAEGVLQVPPGGEFAQNSAITTATSFQQILSLLGLLLFLVVSTIFAAKYRRTY